MVFPKMSSFLKNGGKSGYFTEHMIAE